MRLCVSVCARPSVCVQFCFKCMDIFSLDGEVHFLSWLYTSSVLSIQNIDLNDVSFLLFFQFLFIVSAVIAVVYCYHRSAIRITSYIATPMPCMYVCGGCVCLCVYIICAYMCVYIFLLYLLFICFCCCVFFVLFFKFYVVSVSFSLLLLSFSTAYIIPPLPLLSL